MVTNFLHNLHNLDGNILTQTFIEINNHTYLVSTIDLKFNISSNYNIPPQYYETKIFSVGKEDIYYNDTMFLDRYSNVDEAIGAHNNILKCLKNGSLKMQKGFFEFIFTA